MLGPPKLFLSLVAGYILGVLVSTALSAMRQLN